MRGVDESELVRRGGGLLAKEWFQSHLAIPMFMKLLTLHRHTDNALHFLKKQALLPNRGHRAIIEYSCVQVVE